VWTSSSAARLWAPPVFAMSRAVGTSSRSGTLMATATAAQGAPSAASDAKVTRKRRRCRLDGRLVATELLGQLSELLVLGGLRVRRQAEAVVAVARDHVDVIPRYSDDGLRLPAHPQPAEHEELAQLAEELSGD